jgi:hypothetical protein
MNFAVSADLSSMNAMLPIDMLGVVTGARF